MDRLKDIKLELTMLKDSPRDIHKLVTITDKFIDDIDWLIEQAEKVKRYENIIHAIANIDTIFMLPDGAYREWDDKEALEEIEKMVMPVWNEHCEKSRKETDKMFKEWGVKTSLD